MPPMPRRYAALFGAVAMSLALGGCLGQVGPSLSVAASVIEAAAKALERACPGLEAAAVAARDIVRPQDHVALQQADAALSEVCRSVPRDPVAGLNTVSRAMRAVKAVAP